MIVEAAAMIVARVDAARIDGMDLVAFRGRMMVVAAKAMMGMMEVVAAKAVIGMMMVEAAKAMIGMMRVVAATMVASAMIRRMMVVAAAPLWIRPCWGSCWMVTVACVASLSCRNSGLCFNSIRQPRMMATQSGTAWSSVGTIA